MQSAYSADLASESQAQQLSLMLELTRRPQPLRYTGIMPNNRIEVCMCHRMSPLDLEELREAMDEFRETGHARVPQRDPSLVVADAYPGARVALLVPGSGGELEATELSWGFENPQAGSRRPIFNTRIETALAQERSGRGLWAEAIMRGRCLIPVRAFFEPWTREPSRRGTQARFTLPGHGVFLLAGIHQGGRFSVVTTEPNESVSAIHGRMPLVLGPGESSQWLGDSHASLANRPCAALGVEWPAAS